MQVLRRGVEEVIVDILVHACGHLEKVEGTLASIWFGAVLGGSNGRECGGDVEYDAGFFESKGVLRSTLTIEGVVPRREDESSVCLFSFCLLTM